WIVVGKGVSSFDPTLGVVETSRGSCPTHRCGVAEIAVARSARSPMDRSQPLTVSPDAVEVTPRGSGFATTWDPIDRSPHQYVTVERRSRSSPNRCRHTRGR